MGVLSPDMIKSANAIFTSDGGGKPELYEFDGETQARMLLDRVI